MSESELPIQEPVFVLKQGEKRGPYSVEEIFDLLESGELSYEDICLREGASECERIRDILDWENSEEEKEELSSGSDLEENSDSPDPQPVRKREFLYMGCPSLVTFPLPLICLVGGVLGGLWFSWAGEWVTLTGFLIAIISFAYIAFQRSVRQYFISAKRVEISTGFIAKSSREALIADIRAINVVRRGITGMMGVGTVEFNTTGDEPEVVFQDVWAANEVKALVRRIQDGGEEGIRHK